MRVVAKVSISSSSNNKLWSMATPESRIVIDRVRLEPSEFKLKLGGYGISIAVGTTITFAVIFIVSVFD
jgi:hypothetical protein